MPTHDNGLGQPSYIIVNKYDRDLAWSNDFGWTECDFDIFTVQERERLSLPVDGEWVDVLWIVAA